jgi:hypothetical protein
MWDFFVFFFVLFFEVRNTRFPDETLGGSAVSKPLSVFLWVIQGC